MKKVFWAGIAGLILFELANVYFIMPFPGSQQHNTLELAYFLYCWRWLFRITFASLILISLLRSEWKRKIFPAAGLLLVASAAYILNFQMAADSMFRLPRQLILANAATNKIDSNRLVIGVALNGNAKAYPIKMIGYHHQVPDTLDGKPILVTYCTVCRTGRVYQPLVNGKPEHFRLVGMDHFNAMIEDERTRSWWQQATGTAVTGPLKGTKLPELQSQQTSLAQWVRLYPTTLIMQEDPAFASKYDTTGNYETGKSKKELTGTDSLSWKEKSWVVGLEKNNQALAVDWNELKAKKIIRNKIGNTPFLLVLAADNRSFFAYEDPQPGEPVALSNDTLIIGTTAYLLNGKAIDSSGWLSPLKAYQEFWHSWRQFHPGTTRN